MEAPEIVVLGSKTTSLELKRSIDSLRETLPHSALRILNGRSTTRWIPSPKRDGYRPRGVRSDGLGVPAQAGSVTWGELKGGGGELSPNFASWNQLDGWLRQLEALRPVVCWSEVVTP